MFLVSNSIIVIPTQSQPYLDYLFSILKIFAYQTSFQEDLDKNNYISQTTRFNHTMIFFKLTDKYRYRDIYTIHHNGLGHMLIT